MSYAKLGYGCMTSMDILVSNQKYIPPSSPVYKKAFTVMFQYPGPETLRSGPQTPASEVNKRKITSEYKSGCCGR